MEFGLFLGPAIHVFTLVHLPRLSSLMKFQSPKDWKLFQQSESGENDSTGAPVTLASNFLPVENENVQADI